MTHKSRYARILERSREPRPSPQQTLRDKVKKASTTRH
jgi:hypothetical protein